jgi:hypothetical protein
MPESALSTSGGIVARPTEFAMAAVVVREQRR